MDLSEVVAVISGNRAGITLTALFWTSAIEYLFPVFPGDTITIAGAVLVVTNGLPATGVFVATMSGGLLGSAIHFQIGRLCQRAEKNESNNWLIKHPLYRRMLAKAGRISSTLARRGTLLLIINRFLPGIRSALFIAAGMAGMPWWKAMLTGAISSAMWTGLLILAGMKLGANLEVIQNIFRTYSVAAWLAVATCVTVWIAVHRIRRRKESKTDVM